MTVRVVIADDEILVRSGLRMILHSEAIEIVGEAASGSETLRLVEREHPDLVLLDIRMPDGDGIAVTATLRSGGDQTPILILTTFDTDELVVDALRAGANGYLLKDTPPQRLIEAVIRAADGEVVLSPTTTMRLIDSFIARTDTASLRARSLLATLSAREREVAVAVSKGLTNGEIARELYIGVTTVKTHIAALFAKLGATNRIEVARLVYAAQPDGKWPTASDDECRSV